MMPCSASPAALLRPAPGVADEPQVLRPFHRAEALTLDEAADIACRSKRRVREWCIAHCLGRRIHGRYSVSKVALAMFLEGDPQALKAYLAGDRFSELVTIYFKRCGVPLPRCPEVRS